MHFGGSWIFVAVLPWASRKQVSVTRLVTLFVHSSSLKYVAICETKKIIDERWEHGLKLKHKKCSHENDILYPYSIYSYRNKLEMDFVKLRQLVYSFSPCWSHSMSLSLAFHRFKTLITSPTSKRPNSASSSTGWPSTSSLRPSGRTSFRVGGQQGRQNGETGGVNPG